MESSSRASLLSFCLAVAINHFTITKAQCYYPGGAWASDQFPCDLRAYTTLCCPTGWTCFSNNLCIATDPSVVSSELPLGTAIRGTCTNPLWNDTACGDFCLNDPVSSNNGSLVPCGNNEWCCQPDSADGMCDCNTGKGTFQVSDGTAQTIIGVVGLQYTSTGSVVLSSATQSSSAAVSTVGTVSIVSTTVSLLSTVRITSVPSGATNSASSGTPSSMTPASTSESSSITTSSSASKASTKLVASTTATGSASVTSQTGQLETGTPVTQTIAFRAGVGAAAGVAAVIILALAVWGIFAWRRRRIRSASNGGFFNGRGSQEPMASTTPFQIPPTPHPYGESQFSTSQSRTALAEQVSHNRRTPRPIDVIDENNPYADSYMAGGR